MDTEDIGGDSNDGIDMPMATVSVCLFTFVDTEEIGGDSNDGIDMPMAVVSVCLLYMLTI